MCNLGEGFREYAQSLIDIGANYGHQTFASLVVSRKKLTTTVMTDEYFKIKDQLKENIRDEHLAFTTDMWTDEYTQRSFISLSVHYINKDFELKVALLGVREFFEDKKTGQNIIDNTKNILDEFNLIDKLGSSVFVTDNGKKYCFCFEAL